MITPTTNVTIQSAKRLIATKSQQLRKYFSEEIYNLETGEHYSSRFQQNAVQMAQLLRQRWKLLTFATGCVMLLAMGPALAAAYRRRLGWSTRHKSPNITVKGATIINNSNTWAAIRGSPFLDASTDKSWTVNLLSDDEIDVGVATEDAIKLAVGMGGMPVEGKVWAKTFKGPGTAFVRFQDGKLNIGGNNKLTTISNIDFKEEREDQKVAFFVGLPGGSRVELHKDNLDEAADEPSEDCKPEDCKPEVLGKPRDATETYDY